MPRLAATLVLAALCGCSGVGQTAGADTQGTPSRMPVTASGDPQIREIGVGRRGIMPPDALNTTSVPATPGNSLSR